MNPIQSRAIEERVKDELTRWIELHRSRVPATYQDHVDDIARDTGIAFALGYVDAIAMGLIGPEEHDGRAPVLGVTRLRIGEEPVPALDTVDDEPHPDTTEVPLRFGVWLRPTDRAQSADLQHFFSMLRLTWGRQAFSQRVFTVRRLQPLAVITVNDAPEDEPANQPAGQPVLLLREGYGDVIP